jgi:hypothetical protein
MSQDPNNYCHREHALIGLRVILRHLDKTADAMPKEDRDAAFLALNEAFSAINALPVNPAVESRASGDRVDAWSLAVGIKGFSQKTEQLYPRHLHWRPR